MGKPKNFVYVHQHFRDRLHYDFLSVGEFNESLCAEGVSTNTIRPGLYKEEDENWAHSIKDEAKRHGLKGRAVERLPSRFTGHV